MAAPGTRSDPLMGFNFLVSLIDATGAGAGNGATGGGPTGGTGAAAAGAAGTVAAGFSEVTGLEATLQVEEYSEGGENRFVHKFPTRMTWANLVLKHGIGIDRTLWAWHWDYVNGRGKRRDGLIVLTDEQRKPVKTWMFRRGFPLKWTGPALNAQQGSVAIESIEVVHEGLELMPA